MAIKAYDLKLFYWIDSVASNLGLLFYYNYYTKIRYLGRFFSWYLSTIKEHYTNFGFCLKERVNAKNTASNPPWFMSLSVIKFNKSVIDYLLRITSLPRLINHPS